LFVGDMGYSYVAGTSVSNRVFARLPATIELAAAATVVAIVLSIPLGVISATRRGEPADYAATVFSLGGISTPNFWLGIMLVLVLSVQFGLFPTSRRAIGFVPALELLAAGNPLGVVAWLEYITLPAITLGTYFTALVTRLTRSGMLDELGKTYVRAARAKGLPETLVRYKHALRNTLIPVITVLGLQFGTLIGGAVITEAVFAWPGLGTLVINSINARDWPLIQGCLIVIGTSFVLVNIVVDALYAYVNPQVVYD
jgi:peptide/nickel transport system permease protein